jgi:hypothetical protein
MIRAALVRPTAHKAWVAAYLARYVASGVPPRQAGALLARAARHDLSKYRRDEARAFLSHALLPPGAAAGTPAYDAMLVAFERQVELHHARNRHHPEHHPGGYAQMTEVDRVEMVADWAAAVRRRPGADLERTIAEQAARHGIGDGEAERLRTIARRMGALAR